MKILKPAKDSRNHSRDFTNNEKAPSKQNATVQKSSAVGDKLQAQQSPLQMAALEEENQVQMKKAPLQFALEEEEVQMKKGPLQFAAENKEELQMKKGPLQFVKEEEELQMKKGPLQFATEPEEELQMKKPALGLPINDNPSLEQEADIMGKQAVQMKEGEGAEQPKQQDEGFKVDQKEFFEKATKIASNIPGTNSMCSHGTRQLFEQLTGSKELYSVVNPKEYAAEYSDAEGKVEGTQANNQAEYLAKSKNFTEVTFDEAVAAVKSGGLVISVWKNPEWQGKGDTGHSGHLNILMPEYYSGNWNKEKKAELPRTFDTGVGKRWPTTDRDANKQTINYTYGNDKHKDVKFYKYTPQKSQPVTQ